MTKEAKIDLTLLKRLVSELEKGVEDADAKKVAGGSAQDYIVDVSKCSGLAAGVASEATALISDMRQAIIMSQAPSSKEDVLAKLLGLGPGTGGLSGSN